MLNQVSPSTIQSLGVRWGSWGTIQHRSSSGLSMGGHHKQFWHGQRSPLLDVVHPAFPLMTMVLPTVQETLKYGLVLERLSWHITCPKCVLISWQLLQDIPDPWGPARKLSCSTPSFRSYAASGKCGVSSGIWCWKPGFFFSVSRVSHSHRGRGDKRHVQLELPHQTLFNLAITAMAEATMMWIFAEQVPSLARVALRYLKLVFSCNFWAFMLTTTVMLFVLLIMVLFFCVLTFVP